MPAGPKAQGMRNGPAVSQPRALFPASGRTRNCERRRDEFIADSRAEERSERETSSQGADDLFAATTWTPEAGIRPHGYRPQATLRTRAAFREDRATGFGGKKWGRLRESVSARCRPGTRRAEFKRAPSGPAPNDSKPSEAHEQDCRVTWLSVYELRTSVTTIRTTPTSRARQSESIRASLLAETEGFEPSIELYNPITV